MPPPKTQRKRWEFAPDLKPSERSFEGARRWLVCQGIWETMTLAWGRLRLGVSWPELPTPDILHEGNGAPSMGKATFSRAPEVTPKLEASLMSSWGGLWKAQGQEKLEVANQRCSITCVKGPVDRLLAGRPLKSALKMDPLNNKQEMPTPHAGGSSTRSLLRLP